MEYLFLRFTRWHITPRGATFLQVYGQPHEWLCSSPVGVLFFVGSEEKKQQPSGQRRKARRVGSRVQRLRPLGQCGRSSYLEHLNNTPEGIFSKTLYSAEETDILMYGCVNDMAVDIDAFPGSTQSGTTMYLLYLETRMMRFQVLRGYGVV